MKLSNKYTPTGMEPMPGARAGLWLSCKAQEVATAEAAGVGPGVPDDEGTPTPGTVVPGSLVEINASGNLQLATSPDWTAAMPKMIFCVFSGDDDFSGSLVGDLLCYHGGGRLDTQQYNPAGSYVPGMPLIASAGLFTPKVAANDHFQVIAVVGPKGLSTNGVLDVLLCQGSLGA